MDIDDEPRNDRLDDYRIYQISLTLCENFWKDSELIGRDYRGHELVRQQVRSIDSICAISKRDMAEDSEKNGRNS